MDKDGSPTSTPSERQGVQVIARAAALLRALGGQSQGLTLGQVAKAVGLPRSTVQRLVDALAAEGFVMAASATSGVRLGPALLALAAATRFHMAEVARDTLQALAKACGETVDLSLLDQDKATFIDQVPGTHRLTAVSAVGLSFPLHASANGKALMATLDDAALARLRHRLPLRASTPHTITSWEALMQDLAAVRRSGVAHDREENALGICAIAVALKGPSGEPVAISIPVPTQRFGSTETELTRLLVEHAARLQRRLEGSGTQPLR